MPSPLGWGLGGWGGIDGEPWGGIGDVPSGAITLDGVSSPGGLDGASWLVDILGGDILTVVGTGFSDPMIVEVLSGTSPGYLVEGTCYMFDARYDLRATKLYVGTPPLGAGVYHLRVTAPSGSTAVIEDVLKYHRFAEELKVERARVSLTKAWEVGRKLLRRGG